MSLRHCPSTSTQSQSVVEKDNFRTPDHTVDTVGSAKASRLCRFLRCLACPIRKVWPLSKSDAVIEEPKTQHSLSTQTIITEAVNFIYKKRSKRVSATRRPRKSLNCSLLSKAVYDHILGGSHIMALPSPLKGRAALTARSRKDVIDLAHFTSRLPLKARPILERTDASGLVDRMFPVELVPEGARYMAACCWSWLCVVDDLTEGPDSTEGIDGLDLCVFIFEASPYEPLPDHPAAQQLMGALHHAVQTTTFGNTPQIGDTDQSDNLVLKKSWKLPFWAEMATVARALRAESSLRSGFSMREWLELRVVTITCRPLLTLLRFALAPPTLAAAGRNTNIDTSAGPLESLPLILGLENDILGFSKDYTRHNPMSAIQLLIRDGWTKESAYQRVLELHNARVMEMLSRVATDRKKASTEERRLLDIASTWPWAMSEWMIGCKRYSMDPLASLPSP